MELMVSVGIMVLIILAVGVIFSGTSRAVSVSNATMEMMSSIRAVQAQIERDITGIDKNGFLVIRSSLNNTSTVPLKTVNSKAATNKTGADLSYHFDQLSFISLGSFPNRTGADTASPFSETSSASAAHIWWGQGVLESANPPDASYISTGLTGQGSLPPGHWAARYPTGVLLDNDGKPISLKENECTLMRHATLLMPGPVDNGSRIYPTGALVPVMAYPNIALSAGTITGTREHVAAHITSSRYAVAALTPSQVMQLAAGNYNPSNPFPEADMYTYRFRALNSVYDTEVNSVDESPFVNGYFRTTPIVMSAVSSFKVEWTDGTQYAASTQDVDGNLIEFQTKWYGPTFTYGGGGAPNLNMEQFSGMSNLVNGPNGGAVTTNDQYVACFSFYNKPYWPKALRITLHIASDRLPGGRDFVQIVNLPQ